VFVCFVLFFVCVYLRLRISSHPKSIAGVLFDSVRRLYGQALCTTDKYICHLPASCQHRPAAAQSKDLAWRERSTTSLVHAIGTTTSCAVLRQQNLVGRAAADAFLTVASDLLTTIPTPSLPGCSSSVHCWSHLTTKPSRSQPKP